MFLDGLMYITHRWLLAVVINALYLAFIIKKSNCDTNRICGIREKLKYLYKQSVLIRNQPVSNIRNEPLKWPSAATVS